MNCAEATREIPLYSYGEVNAQIEEALEAHIEICADCRKELARHKAFLEALDQRPDAGETALLAMCRADLRRRVSNEPPIAARPWTGWFDRLRDLSGLHIPMRIPVGAMALVAVGWFGARYTPERFGGVAAGLGGPMLSSVRSVEPDASGKIQIAIDRVQSHIVTGDPGDPKIQALLLEAMREESNPGVRVESIGVLQSGADSAEVRSALIDAASHDPNPGVRLKAVESLRQYSGDASVRTALAGVLLKDDNAGVRMQAIDLLSAHRDESIIGVLQDAVQKDQDSYIRTRCRELLEAMKASVGTY